MKGKRIKLAAILLVTGSLSACNGANRNGDAGADLSECRDAENPYPMAFDNYGRNITITKKPEKALTLGPNCTELFAALGLEEYVVGRSLLNHSRGPLEEYADAVNRIPQLNYGSATREAVIASGAEFIYAIDWEIGTEGVDIEEVQNFGMSVYINSASTLEEQYREILDIGRIFDAEEEAEDFVANQKERIRRVQDSIRKREPVDVLVYDSRNSGIFTCSGSNFETVLIECAGGHNIFDDLDDKQWMTVSYEEVLKRNPDIILIHDYDVPSIEDKIAEIKANPVLSQLDCVKKERFVSIDLESVLPGSRMAYTIELLSEAFFSF